MAKLKVEEGHGIAPNTLLNNENASMAAEGLYTWIQSKPNGRKFSAERIALSHPDTLYSIKKTLKELEKLKYLVRKKYQDETGKRDREYVLHISPLVDTPPTVKPTVEIPTAVNGQILVNNTSKQDIVNNTSITSSKDDVNEQSSGGVGFDDFIPSKDETVKKTTPQPPSKKPKEFGDAEINLCIATIKDFNQGAIDGSTSDQRIRSRHLISKLKSLPKVSEGKMDRATALRNVLKRVSSNKYHNHKIGGPQMIYDKWGELTQIALTTTPVSELDSFISNLPPKIKQMIDIRTEKMKELGKIWENIDQVRSYLQSKGIAKKSVQAMINR